MSRIIFLVFLWICIGLSGCGRFFPKLDEVVPDKRKEYKKAESLPDLEVPPDLSADTIRDSLQIPAIDEGGNASYSTYQERVTARSKQQDAPASGSLPEGTVADEQVIVVEGGSGQIWGEMRAFWRDQGFSLDLDDQELGVLETEWREDKENLVRDKFKVFVDTGENPGTAAIYISHIGEEMLSRGEKQEWVERARDRQHEKEVASRLKLALTGQVPVTTPPAEESQQAEPVQGTQSPQPAIDETPEEEVTEWARITDTGNGKLFLTVPEDFTSAWRDTGMALEQTPEFVVKDKDRSRGVYEIQYMVQTEEEPEDKGMLSGLAFWKGGAKLRYQISVTGVGARTEIVVLNEEGRWDESGHAADVLHLLQGQLNNTQPVAGTRSEVQQIFGQP